MSRAAHRPVITAVLASIALAAAILLSWSAAGTAGAAPDPATLHATWTKLSPLTAPSPRATTMAYDGATHQVVLFGGYGPGALDDTWTWDGTAWTQQTPVHVPTARVAQQMAYDAQTGQLIMFGGDEIAVRGLGDTWEWNGSDWTQLLPPNGPANRSSAAMAYDPATHQIVMFGGVQYGLQHSGFFVAHDTWTWDGTTWTQHTPASSPPPTSGASMAFDPAIGKLVLFGGVNASNDTWAWDGTSWSKLSSSASPPARYDVPLALDSATSEIILGTASAVAGTTLADTWALDSAWTPLHPSTPSPALTGAAVATDPGTGHLVVFGGQSGQLSNQTWLWGPLFISPAPLPAGATGLPYSRTLKATGATGALHWKLASGALPPGLALSPQGVLSGTPTAVGSWTFKVAVTDSSTPAQTARRTLTLTVGTGPTPSVYVANGANSEIHGFSLTARGNATPLVTLAGPHTTLNGPAALLFSPIGELYVANANVDTVDLFGVGATGDTAPSRILGGGQTGLHAPDGLALGADGELFVADRPANAITVYAPGASGDAAPIRTIAGPDTQLDSPHGLAVDAAGHLWVANTPAGTLTEYPAGAGGDTPPMAVIGGPATSLNDPQGLAQGLAGQLLVANTYGESIPMFPNPGITGNALPSSSLAGGDTLLSFPVSLDLDAAGRLYVANQFAGVNIYPAGTTSDTAPLATIGGAATGLSAPEALAVTPPLYIRTRSLPRAIASRRYRARLFAGLGRAPLHWAIVAGHLPRGLGLTPAGRITGTPRAAGNARVTLGVTDSTRPRMRSHRTFRLVVRAGQ
jgi:hypothetical protein